MYDLVRAVHVPVALTCIPAFWIPVFATKGGRLHVLVGRYFVCAMSFVALTGMTMGAWRLLSPDTLLGSEPPAEKLQRLRSGGIFFLYLGVITLAPLLHGWRVVRTRRAPEAMRNAGDVGLLGLAILASLGIAAAAFAVEGASPALFLGLSPIGLAFGLVGLSYVRAPRRARMGWWYAHMGAMIGAGIAAHTALAVFVVQGWIVPDLEGFWRLVPWLLPTAVGVPVLLISIRRAMRRFGEA